MTSALIDLKPATAHNQYSNHSIATAYSKASQYSCDNQLSNDLRSAFHYAAESDLSKLTSISVLGSTDFYSKIGQDFCLQLGINLAKQNILLSAGGLKGVGETVTSAFATNALDGGKRVIHFLPRVKSESVKGIPQNDWEFGKTLPLGEDWSQRREGLARWSKIYVMVEGGPGTNHEANTALENGAVVIPLIASGGAASGMRFQHDNPAYAELNMDKLCSRLKECNFLNSSELQDLADPNSTGAELANLVSRIIARNC